MSLNRLEEMTNTIKLLFLPPVERPSTVCHIPLIRRE